MQFHLDELLTNYDKAQIVNDGFSFALLAGAFAAGALLTLKLIDRKEAVMKITPTTVITTCLSALALGYAAGSLYSTGATLFEKSRIMSQMNDPAELNRFMSIMSI